MTLEEFVTLTLPDRIRWLHSEDGPRGRISLDALASILGTKRQTIIGWEKYGREPTRFADALAQFSGFPPWAFRRRGAEEAAEETTLALLRELRGSVEDSANQTALALEAIAEGIARIEERLPDGVARARKAQSR